MMTLPYNAEIIVGRREMVRLTELGLTLCAKIDTGARTSALHAENIEAFEQAGQRWVRFITRSGGPDNPAQTCVLPVHDQRRVTSSNGQTQWRYVINTPLRLGKLQEQIQLSLTDRSQMRNPILLGRRALQQVLVAPGKAFLHGKQ